MGAHSPKNPAAGFSLAELMVAMAITLTLMATASSLLSQSMHVRMREDQRSDAIADAQRALNIMSREIAGSGYRLPSDLKYTPPGGSPTAVAAHGLLPAFCDGDSVAFVSNANAATGDNGVGDADEAVLFTLHNDAVLGQSFLVRKDMNAAGSPMILANRVDALEIRYIDRDAAGVPQMKNLGVGPTALTVGMKITVRVTLPEVGAPGSSNFVPEWRTSLESDVALRNAALDIY